MNLNRSSSHFYRPHLVASGMSRGAEGERGNGAQRSPAAALDLSIFADQHNGVGRAIWAGLAALFLTPISTLTYAAPDDFLAEFPGNVARHRQLEC